jgi:hypothetical protein
MADSTHDLSDEEQFEAILRDVVTVITPRDKVIIRDKSTTPRTLSELDRMHKMANEFFGAGNYLFVGKNIELFVLRQE